MSKHIPDTMKKINSVPAETRTERYINKLKGRAITNSVKFNKNKCRILHVGQGKPDYTYRWGDEKLESSPVERDLGFLAGSKMNLSQDYLLTDKRDGHKLVVQLC